MQPHLTNIQIGLFLLVSQGGATHNERPLPHWQTVFTCACNTGRPWMLHCDGWRQLPMALWVTNSICAVSVSTCAPLGWSLHVDCINRLIFTPHLTEDKTDWLTIIWLYYMAYWVTYRSAQESRYSPYHMCLVVGSSTLGRKCLYPLSSWVQKSVWLPKCQVTNFF